MLYWLIPLILIGLALSVIIVLVLKKIPQLRVMNVDAMPKERTRQLKEQLILDRLSRKQAAKFGKVGDAVMASVKTTSKVGRRAVQKLYAMEQYYKKLQKQAAGEDHALDEDAVKKLIDEAERLEREEEYIPAEKRYIEIISHHPKRVEAYEGLGNLYIETKQLGQARETLAFALRLSPDDASLRMSMAELELLEDNPKAAVEQLRKAVEKRPTNPKYLDAYIDASLAAKIPEDAKKGLSLMKKANPENSKIPDWQAKMKEILKVSSDSSQKG